MIGMSTDQELIQRGKMVTDFQQAKARLAALRSQAADLSKTLIRIGQALQNENLENGALDAVISGLPAKEDLQQLVSDVRAAQKTINDVQKGMRQIGIEIS